MHERAWVRHITGPRTMRLLNEFIALWNLVEQVQLTPGVPDTFCWRLTDVSWILHTARCMQS
jgi:hypothetical protein